MGILKKTVGEKVKEVRTKKKMTQSELGNKINVSQQTIYKIESGEVEHSRYLYQIAEALDVSYKWLVGLNVNNKDILEFSGLPENFVWMPILDLKEAVLYQSAIDFISEHPERIEESIIINQNHCDNLNCECFGVIVADRSMKPNVVPGDIVVINPVLTPALGDMVLIKIQGYEKAVLRKFIGKESNVDEGRLKAEFVPFNKDYPSINLSLDINIKKEEGNGTKIIGPAVLLKKFLAGR